MPFICPRGAVRLDLIRLSEKWWNRNRCPKERFPLVPARYLKNFPNEKNRSKPFSTRERVCANVFECARMFFGCNRSNSNVRVCLRSVKFFRVCAQCCQQTNSFVFPTGTFVYALSNSFLLARSPPNVPIPL